MITMMDLLCPRCAAKVPAADANLERMVAKCGACDAVFRIEPRLGARAGGGSPPRPPSITEEGEAPPAPGEPGYRASARLRARGPLRLTYRWWTPAALFTLAFSLAWNTFLVIWYVIAISSGSPWTALAFPLLHVAGGVGIFYWSVAKLLNRSVVQVEGRKLTVRHGPLWWPGARELETDHIRQLFVRRRTTRGKNGNTTIRFAVCADLDGTALDLLGDLSRLEDARYIEQRLEEHLSIVDDPAMDELDG
jgi:hypothetical protein